MQRFRTRRSLAAIYGLIFIILGWVFVSNDFFDLVYEFTRSREEYELDEFLSLIPVVMILLTIHVFISRKQLHKLYEKEYVQRVKIEKQDIELKELNENLKGLVEAKLKEIRNKDKILMQQSKMAEMGEMIGVIAHQWKQPLSAITLINGAIADVRDDHDTLVHMQQMTNEQIQYMSQTIDDFRNFFSPLKRKQTFQIGEKTSQMVKMLAPMLKKEVIKVVQDPCMDLKVSGYPNEFQQVVLNIITNARDAFVERHIAHKKIHIFYEKTETMNIVHIRDNGGGIPEELLPDEVFESYVSTKGERGTGIGLQLAKTIIEGRMSGKIWVHNVENGAEFVIELPLAD